MISENIPPEPGWLQQRSAQLREESRWLRQRSRFVRRRSGASLHRSADLLTMSYLQQASFAHAGKNYSTRRCSPERRGTTEIRYSAPRS
jgi:hypothetical protein